MNTIHHRIIKLVATFVGAAALTGVAASGFGIATAGALPPDPCVVGSCRIPNLIPGLGPISLNPQPLPPGFRLRIGTGRPPAQ
jgi:hypothetical protein